MAPFINADDCQPEHSQLGICAWGGGIRTLYADDVPDPNT